MLPYLINTTLLAVYCFSLTLSLLNIILLEIFEVWSPSSTELLWTFFGTSILYTVRILIMYMCLNIASVFYGISFGEITASIIVKMIILCDLPSLVGDLAHSIVIILKAIPYDYKHASAIYQAYPFALSNISSEELIVSGMLKDINLFQAASLVLFAFMFRRGFSCSNAVAFSISLFTTTGQLIISNLFWALLIANTQWWIRT